MLVKILYAEDYIPSQKLVGKIIEKSPYIIDFADDGYDALQKIKDNPPDLIITDIAMPDMDGFELTRIIKTTPAYKHIPIIMLSAAETNVSAKIKGVGSGADRYIYKPFKAQTLLEAIRNALESSNSRLKISVKSDNIFLFGFENKKRYFDEIAEIICELSEEKAFLKEETANCLTFFSNLRDIFINNFSDNIDKFKMGYYIGKNKIIIKILWEHPDIIQEIDGYSIFDPISKFADAFTFNRNMLLFQKNLTSAEDVLNRFHEIF